MQADRQTPMIPSGDAARLLAALEAPCRAFGTRATRIATLAHVGSCSDGRRKAIGRGALLAGSILFGLGFMPVVRAQMGESSPVAAVDRGILGFPYPADDRLPPPDFVPEDQPSPIQAPTMPPAQPPLDLPSDQAVVVPRAIRVRGVTVLPADDVAAIVRDYVGRPIASGDLQDLRHRLTRLYIDNGFITSGVIIPDQDVADGVIELQAVEGRLKEVQIQGRTRIKDAYLVERLMDAATPVLTAEVSNSATRDAGTYVVAARVGGVLAVGDTDFLTQDAASAADTDAFASRW